MVKPSHCVFDDTVTGDRLFVFDIPAPEKNNLFRIEHWGKDDRETTISADVAIELLELAFNGVPVSWIVPISPICKLSLQGL